MGQRIPKHRHHKHTERGVVTMDGRDVYTGNWPRNSTSPPVETEANYKRIVGKFLAAGGRLAPPAPVISILELFDLYKAKGADTDARDKRSGKVLIELFGTTPAIEFNRAALRTVREQMLRLDWTRKDINLCVQRIKHLFFWADDEDILPPTVAADVRRLKGLKEGQARENGDVMPVDEQAFKKAVKYLPKILQTVAKVQFLTGCRAGELFKLTPGMIDRRRSPWVFIPDKHKTAYKKHKRVIYFGPQAQELLKPFLNRPHDQRLFRPCDYRKDRGEVYNVNDYGMAIRRACDQAGVERWHSHQLRHSAGTRIRAQFGPEAAQGILGHKHISMTEHYASVPLQKAAEAAKKVG